MNPPHVALLIETSRTYGRELLRGVRRYLRDEGPWSIFLETRALDTSPPPWLKHWSGDGILARSASKRMITAIEKTGAATVELRSTRIPHSFPFCGVDNRSLGKMVADHFIANGLRHFGVYEVGGELYFEQRRDNFVETVRNAGYKCATYHSPDRSERPSEWERSQNDLASWLESLPKPVGIMACTDQLGFWILDACRRAELRVPDDVAVVGVENDESLSTMATPPLSSVALGGELVGYEAAKLLDSIMKGGKRPSSPMLFPPAGIVERQSSDVVAIEDPDLAEAARFIRDQAHNGIRVSDVLNTVAISRSRLERGFRETLGRSPNQEIARCRLVAAKRLLLTTDLSINQVATQCGFARVQYFCESFKRQFGTTPSESRR